jgi:regulator of RNase E activity RraB
MWLQKINFLKKALLGACKQETENTENEQLKLNNKTTRVFYFNQSLIVSLENVIFNNSISNILRIAEVFKKQVSDTVPI